MLACSELDTSGTLQIQESLGLLTYHDPNSEKLASMGSIELGVAKSCGALGWYRAMVLSF